MKQILIILVANFLLVGCVNNYSKAPPLKNENLILELINNENDISIRKDAFFKLLKLDYNDSFALFYKYMFSEKEITNFFIFDESEFITHAAEYSKLVAIFNLEDKKYTLGGFCYGNLISILIPELDFIRCGKYFINPRRTFFVEYPKEFKDKQSFAIWIKNNYDFKDDIFKFRMKLFKKRLEDRNDIGEKGYNSSERIYKYLLQNKQKGCDMRH